MTRARALIHVGRLSEARDLLVHLEDGADPALDRRQLAGAQASRVELEFAAGNTNLAIELADRALTPTLAEVDVVRYLRIARLRSRAQRQAADGKPASGAELIPAAADSQPPSPLRTAHALLIRAEQADASGQWPEAAGIFEQALELAVAVAVPDDLVEVASSYVLALIAHDDLGHAQEVAGRISPWADRDIRAAWVQAQLFAALGRTSALQAARHRVRALVGERVLADP